MKKTENSDLATQRKRLKFRAWHRGTRESDIILGNFVDQNIETFTEEDCAWFEQLFKEQEQDILDWITGKTPPPSQYETPIMAQIQKLDFLPIEAKSDA